MKMDNLTRQLNEAIDFWIGELERYSFSELSLKPREDCWSLGQVYAHLINETSYYIGEIEICLSTNHNSIAEMSVEGRKLFRMNSFPNIRLKRPDGNPEPSQPKSKEQLTTEMNRLKFRLNQLGTDIENSRYKGKTRHPGLLYFNAKEWFQFAEMHLRHHLRQKGEIDSFLMGNKNEKLS